MQSLNPNATSQLVARLFKAQNYQELINLFKQKLSVNSSDPLSLHMYAAALRRLGHKVECRKVLKKAIKRYPSLPQLKNSYANLLIELGELREAESILKSTTSLDPKFVDAQINLGRVNYKLGKFDQAKNAFQRALALTPKSLNASLGLAEAFVALVKLDDAAAIYQQLIENELTNVKIFNNFAGIKRKQGDLSGAISLYELAMVKYDPTLTSMRNLAACYALDNQTLRAKTLYQKCIEHSPNDHRLQREVAEFLWAKDDENPFSLLRNTLDREDAPLELWFTYIELLNYTEKYELAKSHTEILCQRYPRNPDCMLMMATILRSEGHFKQALSMSRSALDLSVGNKNSRFQNELGYSLLSNGLGVEAIKIYNLLCRKESNNQGWWTLLSTAMRQAGELKKYSWLCDYDNLVFNDFLSVEYDNSKGSDFNTELKSVLMKLHNNVQHPIGQSLRNGTQTYEDLFDDSQGVIRALKESIVEQATYFISNQKPDVKHPFLSRLSKKLIYNGSWSVCLRTNGYHKSHFHPEGWLSGVYYVDVPPETSKKGQGWLVFGCPEIPGEEYVGDFTVKPEVGKLVLFPSYFWHGTIPFLSSQRSRITVAFDLIPAKL